MKVSQIKAFRKNEALDMFFSIRCSTQELDQVSCGDILDFLLSEIDKRNAMLSLAQYVCLRYSEDEGFVDIRLAGEIAAIILEA